MNEIPGFALDDVRREAYEILCALDASRDERWLYEANWRRLWQLLREVNAADLAVDSSAGSWHLVPNPGRGDALAPALAADTFAVPYGRWKPITPATLSHCLTGLEFPYPMDDKRSNNPEDRRRSGRRYPDEERGRDAAERRREQAERDRRLSEEGRQIAETLRTRHEDFREDIEGSREDAERFRDAQEGSREVAEQARDVAEEMRRAAEAARLLMSDARDALGELKNLAKQQREVLERQEKALAAFEKRTREERQSGR